MTEQEFNRMKGGKYDESIFQTGEFLEFNESEPVPNGIDWRNSGAVTPVKN